ncbi:MAG: hypothetical protein ABW098_05665 [Candidatus Thiodiazotropha sp.]
MNSWKHRLNITTLLLILAIAATGAYLYFQWRSPISAKIAKMEMIADQDIPEQDKNSDGMVRFVPISIKAYDEITQRPLFVEGRLPPAEPEPEKVDSRRAYKPLRLKLEGVAMMPDNKVAIIRDLSTNELHRVSQGMNKNDWKVESVDSESATILRKGERLELKLEIEEETTNSSKQPRRGLPFRPSTR